MKKLVAGFVAGVVAAMASTAYADDIAEVVGRTVQGTFPLLIDGKRNEKDVIVIDGTSYLPVRTAAALFGYDVDFQKEQVILNKLDGSTPSASQSHIGGTYKLKCSLFRLSASKGVVVERDGELYIDAMVFEMYISNDGTTVIVSLPNKGKAQFPVNGTYSSGVSGYSGNGLFVSLTALGLRAVADKDTITLVRIQ